MWVYAGDSEDGRLSVVAQGKSRGGRCYVAVQGKDRRRTVWVYARLCCTGEQSRREVLRVLRETSRNGRREAVNGGTGS